MTLVSDIIRDAYRESNLIAITGSPTALETAEALRLLSRIHASVYGNSAGDHLAELPIGSRNIVNPPGFPDTTWASAENAIIPLNQRLLCNLTEATTVALHPLPQPGSRLGVVDASRTFNTTPLTLTGNGRLIEGLTSLTLSTTGFKGTWFYRDDLGSWERVTDALTVSDPWPFPIEFDSLFVTMLAKRLNPRHNVMADAQSIEEYRQTLRQFRARYRQTIQMRSEAALLLLSEVGQNRDTLSYFEGDDVVAFNTGIPFTW